MNSGELDIITRYPAWEFFGTLTFKGRVPSNRKAGGWAMNHMFRVAKLYKVHLSALVWVLREENGGIGGRKHFYLMGVVLPAN